MLWIEPYILLCHVMGFIMERNLHLLLTSLGFPSRPPYWGSLLECMDVHVTQNVILGTTMVSRMRDILLCNGPHISCSWVVILGDWVKSWGAMGLIVLFYFTTALFKSLPITCTSQLTVFILNPWGGWSSGLDLPVQTLPPVGFCLGCAVCGTERYLSVLLS